MMQKLNGVAALATLVSVLLAGLEPASSRDDTSIQSIMNRIQTRSRAIGKALRAPTALEAAGRKRLAADTASLVRLGKEARALTEPAQERKRSQEDWKKAVDDFLRASDELAKVIADPESDQPRMTQSFQTLQKTCTRCHTTFREDDD
jgi:cytochrome c556